MPFSVFYARQYASFSPLFILCGFFTATAGIRHSGLALGCSYQLRNGVPPLVFYAKFLARNSGPQLTHCLTGTKSPLFFLSVCTARLTLGQCGTAEDERPPRSAPEATLTTIHSRLMQAHRTVAARIQRQHPLPLDIKRIRIRSSIVGYRGGVTFIGVVLVGT